MSMSGMSKKWGQEGIGRARKGRGWGGPYLLHSLAVTFSFCILVGTPATQAKRCEVHTDCTIYCTFVIVCNIYYLRAPLDTSHDVKWATLAK